MRRVILFLCLILLTGTVIKAQTVDVTFKVDMSIPIAKGSFVPASDTVFIRGSFNSWGKTALTDANSDSVWEVTVTGQPQNTTLSYKYFYNAGDTWESDPNRETNTGTVATLVLPPYFFDLNPDYFNGRTPYTGISSSVTFNADMRLPLKGAMELSDHAYVAGNFTNWGTGAVEMLDANGDSIYTAVINTFTSGDLAVYKFIWSTGAAGSGTWETPAGVDVFGGDNNRIYGVVDGIDTVSRFWENANPNITLADGNILFVVDMSVANELGVFNPDADSVQIRGEFNGWGDSDPARSLLNQDPGDPNVWFLDVPMEQLVLNDTLIYKFFIKNDPGSTPYANTGWEVAISPSPFGNRDRPIQFMGEPAQAAEYAYFEGIHTDWVVPSGTTINATFSVDMTTATGFNASTDTVVWIPRQPFYYAVHNIPWPGDYPRVLILTDANSDMIYEGTLTINGPDFNGFLYNYGYANASGLTQEAGSQGECRVRYVQQTGPRAFVSPYSFPQDVWTDGEKPEEDPPTSVDEIPGVIPNTYSLEQNYPNPFNPSTTIRFSIPEAGMVSLSIYNLLGEKVGEVLNQELVTGSYEFTYDASKLSSGVYFYTIKVGDFTATKKMLLMK
ncbi:MAG: hypothetical protein A2W11_07430 [Ignavibacteria bacterium RBG_16_35_7]|nr:MAG: hypothetical protein A2W11_07430 [Ignavibacteria bacterium RBG_16_35_7]